MTKPFDPSKMFRMISSILFQDVFHCKKFAPRSSAIAASITFSGLHQVFLMLGTVFVKSVFAGILLCCIAVGESHAQKIKISSLADVKSRDGVFYALPKTLLIVNVKVKQISKKKPLDDSMKDLCKNNMFCVQLGIEQNTKDEVIYKIGEITLSTTAIPDKDEIYSVMPNGRFTKESQFTLSLSEAGLMKGVQVSVADKSLELIAQGLSIVATIVKTVLTFDKTTQPIQFEIQSLLEQRSKIIASPGDTEKIFEKQLAHIDAQILALITYVAGETKIKETDYSFIVDPATLKKGEALNLMKYDSQKGIAIDNYGRNDSYHNPEFLTLKPEDIKSAKQISIKLEDVTDITFGAKIKTLQAATGDKRGRQGFSYRIPLDHIVTVSADGVEKLRTRVPVAQLGSTAMLPYKLNETNLEYYENLGYLKSVTAKKSPTNAESVGKLKDPLNEVTGLLTRESETDKLKEENALLEEQKKNKELKKALESLIP